MRKRNGKQLSDTSHDPNMFADGCDHAIRRESQPGQARTDHNAF